MTADDLAYLTASEVIERFRSRELSPVELLRALIDRAERVEPVIHAFTETHFERALEQARAAEARYAKPARRRRSLEGVPIAVKDESAIAGQRTTQGSIFSKNSVESVSALVSKGIAPDGKRRLLAVTIGAQESTESWSDLHAGHRLPRVPEGALGPPSLDQWPRATQQRNQASHQSRRRGPGPGSTPAPTSCQGASSWSSGRTRLA